MTYEQRRTSILLPVADELCGLIRTTLLECEHIDRVTARAKDADRFLAKADKKELDGQPKYIEPLVQIQDQIGARVVVYFLKDVETVASTLIKYFRHVEAKDIVPDSESEFGYFGRHFIMAVPLDVLPKGIAKEDAPTFFELQIKTLFQHAWSEAEHDLGYKCPRQLTSEEKRLFAYTAAQAWGADRIFDDLRAALSSSPTP